MVFRLRVGGTHIRGGGSMVISEQSSTVLPSFNSAVIFYLYTVFMSNSLELRKYWEKEIFKQNLG